MATVIELSENAIAVLRFEIRGYRAKNREARLPAYRELAVAGIMEPVSESEYRFTAEGMERREEILRQAEDRIERERFAPPEPGNLSESARERLRRHLAGDECVTDANRAAYRELTAARIMYPVSGFAGGPESNFRLTYWGFHRRHESQFSVVSSF